MYCFVVQLVISPSYLNLIGENYWSSNLLNFLTERADPCGMPYFTGDNCDDLPFK